MKHLRNILCIALVLCMLSAFIPAYAESASTVTVDFSQTVCELINSKWTATLTPGYTIVEELTNIASPRMYTSGGVNTFCPTARSLWPADKAYSDLAISIAIPTEGNYAITMQGPRASYFAKFAIYVDQKYVGDYDGETVESARTLGPVAALNSLELTAGLHTITFHALACAGDSAPLIGLYQMIFTPIETLPTLNAVNATTPATLAMGEVQSATATAVMTDESLHIFGYGSDGNADVYNTFTAQSSNTDVVTVTEQKLVAPCAGTELSTKINAIGVGEADVTFTAVVDGVTKSAVKHISVTAPLVPTAVTLDFSQTVCELNGVWTVTSTPGYTIVASKTNIVSPRMYTTEDVKTFCPTARTLWPANKTNSDLAISFEVPVTGIYSIALQGVRASYFAKFAIYVDGIYVGDYDGEKTESARTLGPVTTLNPLSLANGNHEIIFHALACAGDSAPLIGLYQMTFTPIDALPSFASLSCELPDTIATEEPAAISASAIMSNGYTYRLGYSAGGTEDTTEYISITSSDSNTINVTDQAYKIGYGDARQATLVGVNPGTATVTVTAIVGGVTKTVQKEITVTGEAVPQPVLIDFSQTVCEKIGTKWLATSTPGYTIDDALSEYNAYRTYTTEGKSTIDTTMRKFWLEDGISGMFTINVNIPVEGNYQVKFQGGMVNYSGDYVIYIDDNYVGSYSGITATSTRALSAEKILNPTALSAGNHKVSFRLVKKGTDPAPNLILYKMWFTPIESLPTLESLSVSAIPDSISAVCDFTAQALMSDSSVYEFGKAGDGTPNTVNYLRCESSDSEKLEIGESNGAITLTPKKAGSASVSVIACVNGVTKSFNKAITVPLVSGSVSFDTEKSISPTGKKLLVIDGGTASGYTLTGASVFYSPKINKFIAFADSAATSETLALTPIETAATEVGYGVVSQGDTVVDTLDAILVQRMYNGSTQGTDAMRVNGDFNADFELDSIDAAAILSFYVNE